MKRLFLPGLAALILMGFQPALSHSSGAPDKLPSIDELIRQLGDKKFAVREAATLELMNREDAKPALIEALNSSDKEVARRAREALEGMARKDDTGAARKLEDAGKRGQIDQAIELLVRRKRWKDEDACWDLMTSIAIKLTELARKEFGDPAIPPTHEHSPLGNFRKWAERVKPDYQVTGKIVSNDVKGRSGCFVVRAEEITLADSSSYDLLVSSGATHGRDIAYSLIFANGPVNFDSITKSVVICDGDVEVALGIESSLIIARGAVRFSQYSLNSRIISCSTVKFGKNAIAKGSEIKENQAVPLGLVKFFDPAAAGIAVNAGKDGVTITELDKSRPFALAGLKNGDVVTALDGIETKTTDEFRQQLRPAVVMNKVLIFKVRRGKETLEIPVYCKD